MDERKRPEEEEALVSDTAGSSDWLVERGWSCWCCRLLQTAGTRSVFRVPIPLMDLTEVASSPAFVSLPSVVISCIDY